MRCLLSFYVNYARIIKVHPQINKIALKRQKGKEIHSIRCEQTIINVFVVIILQVISTKDVCPTLLANDGYFGQACTLFYFYSCLYCNLN